MNIDEIVDKVDLLRQELNEIGKKKSLQDEEVLRISQQLDELLNIYQKLLNVKKT